MLCSNIARSKTIAPNEFGSLLIYIQNTIQMNEFINSQWKDKEFAILMGQKIIIGHPFIRLLIKIDLTTTIIVIVNTYDV